MSTPSPLQPQGALDVAATPKSRVRITVLTILALHVVFIAGLLLQGCDKQGAATGAGPSNVVSALPPLNETNYFTSFPGDSRPSEPAASATPSNPPAHIPPAEAPSTAPSEAITGFPAPGAPIAPAANLGAATEYTVKKGDTIGELAKKYGVTIQAIIDANPNAKPRNLKIDEKLIIPAPVASSASAAGTGAAAEGEVYVVKQGDNLGRIAKKFGVSVKQLRTANNIKGDRILPKQRLVIPAKAPSSPTPATPSTAGGSVF